jgi:hypothetical protein
MRWGQERRDEPTEIYSIRLSKTVKQKLSTLPVDTIKATLLRLVDGEFTTDRNVIPLDSFSPSINSTGDGND